MRVILVILSLGLLAAPAPSDDPPKPTATPGSATTLPADGKLPHVEVNVKEKQVRVECEAVMANMPLEFFCCSFNTQEHETVLRSQARASHIHLGLLMIGMKPGEPVRYDVDTKTGFPPHGPPLDIRCFFQDKDDKPVSIPAYRMMRNVKTKKEMPPITWVFTGSRVLPGGDYGADSTGYLVSVVNFDLTMIDIPELASSANEALEWEINPDVCPKKGTKVWMIIEPAAKVVVPEHLDARKFVPPPARALTPPSPTTVPAPTNPPEGPR